MNVMKMREWEERDSFWMCLNMKVMTDFTIDANLFQSGNNFGTKHPPEPRFVCH